MKLPRIENRWFLATCLILALVSCTSAAAELATPNVLFLIADDLSASALACYGNRQCHTPNIDRLAAQGVRFTHAYTQYPVCAASRAAIMSGMYPQQIGVIGNGGASLFSKNLGARPSFSQWFRQHDYFAARVSKIYHMRVPGDITAGVDGPDHEASWNERYNCQGPEWMSAGIHQQLSNEALNRDPDKHYGLGFGGSFYVVKSAGDGSEQPDVQAADRAIELIRRNQDRRFFLAVGFVRPHVPLVAPASYFQPYPHQQMQLPKVVDNDLNDIPAAGRGGSSEARGLDSPKRKRQTHSAYYASVSFMDAQVGRVLAALDDLNLRNNTIVIFTSDHGYHLGEHELWQKMSLHEESVRIPLLIAAPGIAPAVRDQLVEQIDIYPTTADLAGLAIPQHCRGTTLRDVMNDGAQQVREEVYCLRGRNDHLLRTQDWAWIRYGQGGRELYSMQHDPLQITNLADHPNYRDVAARMDARLQAKLMTLESRVD